MEGSRTGFRVIEEDPKNCSKNSVRDCVCPGSALSTWMLLVSIVRGRIKDSKRFDPSGTVRQDQKESLIPGAMD